MDDSTPVYDLRLRAGQERAPPASLPRPIARLPRLRPWHEPLAAGLPRRLCAGCIRSTRAARGRTPQLRPARRRTPDLPRPREVGGRGPGEEPTHRQAAYRTGTPGAHRGGEAAATSARRLRPGDAAA